MFPFSIELLGVQLVNGIVLGMIFALIAMGLSLIFGLMGVVNFAHGAFYATGAYLGCTLVGLTGGNFWVALIIAPILVGAIGAIAERGLFSRIYGMPKYFQIFLSFGLILTMTETIRIVWGILAQTFVCPIELNFMISLGFFSYPFYRIFVISFAALLAISVWIFLQKTELGLIIRAGIDDREMVEGLGIGLSNVYTFTFSLGTAIAGLSGVMAGPIVLVYPEMSYDIIIKAFIVVIVGGLGSFRGPIISALILMTLSTLTVLIWPPLSEIVIYIFMAIFLIIRPTGLFGQRVF